VQFRTDSPRRNLAFHNFAFKNLYNGMHAPGFVLHSGREFTHSPRRCSLSLNCGGMRLACSSTRVL
jgi:hypothetical protein